MQLTATDKISIWLQHNGLSARVLPIDRRHNRWLREMREETDLTGKRVCCVVQADTKALWWRGLCLLGAEEVRLTASGTALVVFAPGRSPTAPARVLTGWVPDVFPLTADDWAALSEKRTS